MAQNQLLTDCLPTLAEVLILGLCVLGFPNRFNRSVLVGCQVFIDLFKLRCIFCIVTCKIASFFLSFYTFCKMFEIVLPGEGVSQVK